MQAEKIQKGDVIRSYDFKPMYGRPDCFVEGTVLGFTDKHGYDAIEIRVVKDQFGDEISTEAGPDCRVGHTVFVPQKVSFNDYPGRVINLSRI